MRKKNFDSSVDFHSVIGRFQGKNKILALDRILELNTEFSYHSIIQIANSSTNLNIMLPLVDIFSNFRN
jgi:hypothetical protein